MTTAYTVDMLLDHASRHPCRHYQPGIWVLLMQNHFKELHSLFNVIIPVGLPGVLVDSKRFSNEIALPLQHGQKKNALPHELAKVTFYLIRCGVTKDSAVFRNMSCKCCHLVGTGVLLHVAQREAEGLAEAHSKKAACHLAAQPFT